MSPCQAPGVWPSPLSPLISGGSGRVIHHGCQRKGCNWPGLFVYDSVCVWESGKEKERERDCPCVCVMCMSGVVWLLMLTGNHVSGSVISESDWKLEAGRQRQTRLSRRNYGAGIWSLKTTRKKKISALHNHDKIFWRSFFSPSGWSGDSDITSDFNK